MAAGEIEKVTITITTRNAAFTNEHIGERPEWAVAQEVVRILREFVDYADLIHEIPLRLPFDANGNSVGTITIEREGDG